MRAAASNVWWCFFAVGHHLAICCVPLTPVHAYDDLLVSLAEKQAVLTASPRDWEVGHQLVIPSRPFGYDHVVAVLISVTTDMSPTGDSIVTHIFVSGWCHCELAQVSTRVALVLHFAGCSTPFEVT